MDHPSAKPAPEPVSKRAKKGSLPKPAAPAPKKRASKASRVKADSPAEISEQPLVSVRRMHRRDVKRVWEFLKRVFRDVNRETVEYQRPRTKGQFLEVYEEEGIEQLVFEAGRGAKAQVVAYAECAFEVVGDSWVNSRYFEKRDMRPMFVEELAVHPDYQGKGVGSFALEQLEHLARVRGCTHLVLEVAENNDSALRFYRTRHFYKLDAMIFMAKKVAGEEELLPPRKLRQKKRPAAPASGA